MDFINPGPLPEHWQRDRFVARAKGTQFVAALNSDSTEIDLYDEIGTYGVTAKDFRSKLKDATGDIKLRINSPGGSVTDGIAIYNDLRAHKGKVRVEISGVAASIASIIAMAGDERAMAENAFMMIHNAWGLTVGDKRDHAATISALTRMDDALAHTYATRTGVGIRQAKTMMDDTTWLKGKEALDAGFATELLKGSDAKAKYDLSMFESVPEALAWVDDDTEKTIRDGERALRDAGWSKSDARKVFASREPDRRDAGQLDFTKLSDTISRVRAAFPQLTSIT